MKTRYRFCDTCNIRKEVSNFVGMVCIACKEGEKMSIHSDKEEIQVDRETSPITTLIEESIPSKCEQCVSNSYIVEEIARMGDHLDIIASSTTFIENCIISKDEYRGSNMFITDEIARVDERLDRMEGLLVGLMELVGKIHNDLELSKVKDD